MLKTDRNFAFIDGQNLNMSIQSLGWKLDYGRFRVYLREKYSIDRAYYFLGFVEGNNDLYTALQSQGYILIFKPTLEDREGMVKGNIDAELVLQAMIDFNNYDKAIVVTGDGDFYCLIEYLRAHSKLMTLLVPNRTRYSALLKKSAGEQIAFMNNLRRKLEYTHIKKND